VVALTLGFAMVGTTIPLCSAAGQQRHLQSPSRSARATARYTIGSAQLSLQSRVSLFNQLAGTALDATALAEPVRLSVSQPNHLGRVFVNAIRTSAYSGSPVTGEEEVWIIGSTAQINVIVARGLLTRPALVDCLAKARHTESTATDAIAVRIVQGSSYQIVPVGQTPGHLVAVLLPPDPSESQGSLQILPNSPKDEVLLYSCEVSLPK
jgi:hypothetical protein